MQDSKKQTEPDLTHHMHQPSLSSPQLHGRAKKLAACHGAFMLQHICDTILQVLALKKIHQCLNEGLRTFPIQNWCSVQSLCGWLLNPLKAPWTVGRRLLHSALKRFTHNPNSPWRQSNRKSEAGRWWWWWWWRVASRGNPTPCWRSPTFESRTGTHGSKIKSTDSPGGWGSRVRSDLKCVCVQGSQVSRIERETHAFRSYLTHSRHTSNSSRWKNLSAI